MVGINGNFVKLEDYKYKVEVQFDSTRLNVHEIFWIGGATYIDIENSIMELVEKHEDNELLFTFYYRSRMLSHVQNNLEVKTWMPIKKHGLPVVRKWLRTMYKQDL